MTLSDNIISNYKTIFNIFGKNCGMWWTLTSFGGIKGAENDILSLFGGHEM